MTQAQAIHPDLTLLLRREALSDYALACLDAQNAAEHNASTTSASPNMLLELRRCRARVVVASETLDLVGDDVVTAESWELPPDDHSRDLLTTRVRLALDRISSELESPEQVILTAAGMIEHLLELLERLASKSAATPPDS